ncbi:MAG: AI-2E family transporter, partial [Bacteroidetes bacterium]|nr:AI-2E family transporter [Bacteroidota bacterium]
MASTSNRPFLKVSLLIGSIIVAFWLASFFPEVVLALIISALAAFVLKPFVKFLEFRMGLRRILAILIVFLVSGAWLFVVGYYAGSLLIETIRTMAENFKTFPFEQKLDEAAQQIASSAGVSATVVSDKVR